MKHIFSLPLLVALSILFVATLYAAQPDPKGAFGFVWGDSPATIKQKASAVKLNVVEGASKGNDILAYSGEIDQYRGLFRFACHKNKLYTISVSMADDGLFKKYDEILTEFTKTYGKPAEQETQNGLTVSGWNVGDTTVSVGKFNSTNNDTKEKEYITSILFIQTSVEREVRKESAKKK